jgi:hypothetical protein
LETVGRLPGPRAYQNRTAARIRISSPRGPITNRSTIATRRIKTAPAKLMVWTAMNEGPKRER